MAPLPYTTSGTQGAQIMAPKNVQTTMPATPPAAPITPAIVDDVVVLLGEGNFNFLNGLKPITKFHHETALHFSGTVLFDPENVLPKDAKISVRTFQAPYNIHPRDRTITFPRLSVLFNPQAYTTDVLITAVDTQMRCEIPNTAARDADIHASHQAGRGRTIARPCDSCNCRAVPSPDLDVS